MQSVSSPALRPNFHDSDRWYHRRKFLHRTIVEGVGTMGRSPFTPASRPRPTKDHWMMAQSMGPTVFLYQSDSNIHPHPGSRIYTNVLKTGPMTEPEKLSVHGSQVGPVVEPLLNR